MSEVLATIFSMTREFLTTIAPYREVLLALLSMLVALWAAQALHHWRGSWRAKRRAARAGAGEDAAADLLEEAGYQIVERQARVLWGPLLDGEPQLLELRADYLVESDGQLLVAEVKTGEHAPSLETAATRRQLLEYHVAFAVDGVLLVSPEQGLIQRVAFPRIATVGGPCT
jgi:Holliday junction resolvase-like predicted endonuclease